ncbi:MAG: purine-nucleoside phosphorylase [Leucobacter sp.]|nr:purine-nucleoside phosphorylase [Leucobacter sp.]
MSSQQTLLEFAHSDEAEKFAAASVPHLVTGVGKINAALGLTEALLAAPAERIGRVVVLGTAGALNDDARLDTVYQIEAVVQHDFSLPSPKLVPSGAIVAPHTALLATGDVFVQNDAQRQSLADLGASLVDMESYAYAAVCDRLGVLLQIFKVPSDFADSSTTQEEWDDIAVSKSEQLFAFVEKHLPELLA